MAYDDVYGDVGQWQSGGLLGKLGPFLDWLSYTGSAMGANSGPSPYPINTGALLGKSVMLAQQQMDNDRKLAMQEQMLRNNEARLRLQQDRETELWPSRRRLMEAQANQAERQSELLGQASKDFDYYIKETPAGKQVKRVNKIGPEVDTLLQEGWVPMEAWKATLADQRKFLPVEDPTSPSGISYQNPITGQKAGVAPGKYFYYGDAATGPVQLPTQGPQARSVTVPEGTVRKAAPEVPSTAIEKGVSLNTLIRDVDSLESLYDPAYVGAVDSKLGWLKEKTDIGASPEESTFRSLSNSIANTLMQLRSGAQINEHEFKRLMAEVPDISMGETSFTARLDRFKKQLSKIQADRKRQYEAAGYRGQQQEAQPSEQPAAKGMPPEGTTGTQNSTGRKIVVKGGRWVYAD